MKEVKVVIGKSFGDEGKGATVHKLCRGKKAVVVRHNGGAQAGHTVEDGEFRFVFHQLGSGSRAGCATYWSSTFLPDLLKLGEEAEEFIKLEESYDGARRPIRIYADSRCACTVIYDVLLNHLAEVLRGEDKHGSCGMGIYEATVRSREEQYVLRLQEFVNADEKDIAAKLLAIRENYGEARMQKLKQEYAESFHKPEVVQWVELFYDENVLWNAAEEMCRNFRQYVLLAEWEEIKAKYDIIVMENAQGLMLDCDNTEYYPHLTPSHTGLFHVAEMFAMDEGEYELEVVYVTRTYVTRHGRGRLDYECAKADINPDMIDKTNTPNNWQDALRYAKHPAGEGFWHYIQEDLKQLDGIKCFKKIMKTICVNHLDETDGKIIFSDKEMKMKAFRELCRKYEVKVVSDSWHDDREADITEDRSKEKKYVTDNRIR